MIKQPIGRDDTHMGIHFPEGRTSEIRSVCVETMNRFDVLMYDERTAVDDEERMDVQTELKYHGWMLAHMGVEPLMHYNDDWLVVYDPKTLVEFVGGLLLPFTTVPVPSRLEINPIVRQIGARLPNGAYMFRMDASTPAKLGNFYYLSRLVDIGYNVLGACHERNPNFVGQIRQIG